MDKNQIECLQTLLELKRALQTIFHTSQTPSDELALAVSQARACIDQLAEDCAMFSAAAALLPRLAEIFLPATESVAYVPDAITLNALMRKLDEVLLALPLQRFVEFAPNSAPMANSEAQPNNYNYAVVRVFYATDRNGGDMKTPSKAFGSERADSVTYGTCTVSIPRDHRMGELESPSIWRFEFRQNPEKHVVLLAVDALDKEKFFLEASKKARNAEVSSAFVFVHGYNVVFEDAARRTAQMAYDLGFDGAPIFYSWPSCGKTIAYTKDEENARWAQHDFKQFLDDFISSSQAERIYLIAHSMGNRVLTGALVELLREKPEFRSRIKEIILTAPDIDAAVFTRDIAPALSSPLSSITLYASSKDLALEASKKVHGYPRAGEAGKNLVICPGVETIDATNVDTSLLGHSYFAEARSVLADIYELIRKGERAAQRFWLRPVATAARQAYWEFKL